ncbi:unnamed protein product [Sphagnum jensenii]|uniref:acid phosphatase n=1 Tax=Sphagnum jensenii TaxID=128206 RepID=A0ABP0WKK2_9BRYO
MPAEGLSIEQPDSQHSVDQDEEVGLLSVTRQINNARIKRRRAWIMFGIVFGTLLGVSLILISRIDQHLACRKSSLAVLCRSGSSVQRQTPLNFLVVGDWGRNGLYNQSLVAEQMGNVGAQLNVSFIISTGDNFYENGLTGPDDEQFSTSFSNIYTQKSLQTTWYSVLGNHDYHGNVSAQVDQKVTLRDPRWNCHNNFQLIHDLGNTPQAKVEFFFIDTNPFVGEYWTTKSSYAWQLPIPRKDYIMEELMNLTNALAASTAKWKIVVGHHTMRSVSTHGDTLELLEAVLPILEANAVDLYINGHDHCMQHIKRPDSPVHFLTSGGGSKAWRGTKPLINAEEDFGLRFYYDGQGFAAVTMLPTEVHIDLYNISGQVMYSMNLQKN